MKRKGASHANGATELLFANEVASRLRMSPRQVMNAHRRGILRSYVVDARGTPRFILADVIEDFEKHKTRAAK